MAKKSRRPGRRPPRPARPVRIARSSQHQALGSTSKEVDFSKEYDYVLEDLKRIAIIAAALLVLLIALALIIG
jgi:hypothetical protein